MWHQGRLDAVARSLGIRGWLVPQAVTAAGAIEGLLLPGAGDLPAAPLLQLKDPLAPVAEQKRVQLTMVWSLRGFGSRRCKR